MWENIDASRPDSAHYSVMRLASAEPDSGMVALRAMFQNGANELNMVLFSTSGVHGTYTTIEEIEASIRGDQSTDGLRWLTFLVLHPRLVALRYGLCRPETLDDIAWLKALRASSLSTIMFRSIGWA